MEVWQALRVQRFHGVGADRLDGREGGLHQLLAAAANHRVAPVVALRSRHALGQAGLFEQHHLADQRRHWQPQRVRKLGHRHAAVAGTQQPMEQGEVFVVQPVKGTQVFVEFEAQAGVGAAEVEAKGQCVGAHGVL